MGRLDGQVAIVTGGSQGIGRACCQLLAREGARVAVTDLKAKEGEAVAAGINKAGGTAKFWKMDVADEESVRTTVAEIAQALGAPTVLVNNAGIIGPDKPTHELTAADWDKVLAVNVKGPFFCTKHTVPHMIKARKGSIVNISSIYGLIGAPDVPPYHASKGALRLMTKTDAMIYAQHGVRVNSIHPGAIQTPMLDESFKGAQDPEAAKEQLRAMHPLGRIGDPMEIAYPVLFFASDESSFITGEELVVDGGYTAR
jgi:NAD(P)-dependent dehydrogenase (short-subunit alcohol dehydrogenase family)